MSIKIDLFDYDERIIINSAGHGISLNEFTRKRFLDNLGLSLNISNDPLILSLVRGLIEKISILSDEEWREIVRLIPLHVAYDEES